MMNQEQREGTFSFLCDSFLDRLDRCVNVAIPHSSPNDLAWLGRLNSLGLVMPQIDRLWSAWWAVGSQGQAVAALQYISGLMYFAEDNPIFADWPGVIADDEPYLAIDDSFIFDRGWISENVQFLQSNLTFEYVQKTVERAVDILKGSSEEAVAGRIVTDLPHHSEVLQSRTRELPQLLALPRHLRSGWSL